MMKTYRPMFDLETFCIVRDLVRDSYSGESYLEIRPYLQRFALNTTLTLCYGIRMDSVWDDMLREVLEVGSAISLLRSASENYQDYIPREYDVLTTRGIADILSQYCDICPTTRRISVANPFASVETRISTSFWTKFVR